MADPVNVRKIKKSDEDEKELNEITQSCLEEASSLQVDLETLSKRMMAKILTVAQEFMVLKRPLYNKRHAALNSVPHFWAIAFMNHPKLKLLVDNSVEDCFNYLLHIQVIENDDIRSGFQLVFAFDVNPYFFNCELIKQHTFENGTFSSIKTNIDWKENMNLSNERKIKGRKRGPPIENFFDWLQRSNMNKCDVISDIIKDDLWTDPLKYFFLPDEGVDDNSESESDEDDEFDDIIDSNDDESQNEEGDDDSRKQSNNDGNL